MPDTKFDSEIEAQRSSSQMPIERLLPNDLRE